MDSNQHVAIVSSANGEEAMIEVPPSLLNGM